MPEKKITPTHYEILITIFELDGFIVKRKKGDHIIMTKPGVKRPLVIKTSPRLVHHTGTIIAKQVSVGEIIKSFFHLASTLSAEDMENRLEYLSNW